MEGKKLGADWVRKAEIWKGDGEVFLVEESEFLWDCEVLWRRYFYHFLSKCCYPLGYEQSHCWHVSWEHSSIATINCSPAQEAANKWPFSTSGQLDIWRIHCLCFQKKHDSDTCDQEHLHRNRRQMFASRKSTHFRSNELHWKGGSFSFWRKQSFLTTAELLL